MAGVAQIWLTHKEIDALMRAAPHKGVAVNPKLWEGIEFKLLAAFQGVACPVVKL